MPLNQHTYQNHHFTNPVTTSRCGGWLKVATILGWPSSLWLSSITDLKKIYFFSVEQPSQRAGLSTYCSWSVTGKMKTCSFNTYSEHTTDLCVSGETIFSDARWDDGDAGGVDRRTLLLHYTGQVGPGAGCHHQGPLLQVTWGTCHRHSQRMLLNGDKEPQRKLWN